jgi:Tfp pilus assembly protein PilF
VAILSHDTEGARAFYARALRAEPRDTTALINLGRIALAGGDEKSAEGYLRRAVDINPSEPVATLSLAQLAAARKDYPAAMSWLEHAPETAARFEVEGGIQLAKASYDDAAAAFARAFDLAPSIELATQYYTAARRAGKSDAESKLDAWIRTHPKDASAHFAAGSLALGRGEQDAAVRHYEAVLEVDARNVGALNNLAWIYGERGDARAVQYAERAYNSQPGNAAIADTLGWLYVRNGSKKEGLPLLEKAAVQLPDDLTVQYHWAVALEETGDRARAAAALQKVVAKGVDFSGSADASRRLKALQAAGN